MDEIVSRIRVVLGIEETQPLRKKRIRAADYGSNQSAGNTKSGEEYKPTSTPNENDQEASDWCGFSAVESVHGDHHDIENDDESEDYGMYDSRLAASSEEETTVEEASDDVPQQEEKARHKEPAHISSNSTNDLIYNRTKDLSLSPEPESSSSPPSLSRLTEKASGKISSKPKSTTFLPSLAISGYWSGSESSASDLNTGDAKPRRNRRGQQERRAIWEKKFGRNANHLKKQSTSQNRDEGWDPRRGARSSEDIRGKRGRGRGRSGMRREFRRANGGNLGATGANSDPVLTRKAKAVEQPMHPSWEAAKKRKDENRTATFAGKKIVFD